MKKNLFAIGLLATAISASAQVLTHVDNTAVLYVGEGALMYNGGGMQTKGTGVLDVHGNVMLEGAAGDVLKTLTAAGADQTTAAGNIVLRLNNPAAPTTSTYGQLYIQGIPQGNLTGFISKEFKTPAHGSGNYFQQIAMPFSGKALNTLSAEFGKTFGTTRWTQNEILKFNNATVVSEHFTSLATTTADATGYYMLGSSNNNLNTATPPATIPTIAPTAPGSVYTLNGRAYGNGITRTLAGAGAGVNFGFNGNGTNQYNELYRTYLQDAFSVTNGAWTGDFARNIYQFGNPYFTNLDLKYIGYDEGAGGDGNNVSNIWGIQYDPGTVTTLANGATYFTNAQYQTFSTAGVPVGDVGLMIKPMQSFTIKLRNNTSQTLNFDTLRRFGYSVRTASNPYSVTSQRSFNTPKTKTVKQLGFIAYDENDNELGRGYYVVSPTFITGHQSNGEKSVQVANSSGNAIGTFEEDPVNGMFDSNYAGLYWLYINEANENNFRGKAAPMVLYNTAVKKIQFEIRENAELIPQGQHHLSSQIGFFYKQGSGQLTPIKQGDKIPVNINGATTYQLYYGGPKQSDFGIFAKDADVAVPSRTMVVYNPAIDNYVVRFDPSWKNASVKVYDMSGKLIHSAEGVNAGTDYEIKLDRKLKTTYLVNVVSEQGVEANAKIIR